VDRVVNGSENGGEASWPLPHHQTWRKLRRDPARRLRRPMPSDWMDDLRVLVAFTGLGAVQSGAKVTGSTAAYSFDRTTGGGRSRASAWLG
jgi:hypothetical protein